MLERILLDEDGNFIKLIEKNILDVDKYIDAKINLDKVQDAYLELISGNTDKIKIVVKP